MRNLLVGEFQFFNFNSVVTQNRYPKKSLESGKGKMYHLKVLSKIYHHIKTPRRTKTTHLKKKECEKKQEDTIRKKKQEISLLLAQHSAIFVTF